MKIILDLPDDICCAFLNGIKGDGVSMKMFCYSMNDDDLFDGNEIKVPREKTDGE